jgi:hypothetical protein
MSELLNDLIKLIIESMQHPGCGSGNLTTSVARGHDNVDVDCTNNGCCLLSPPLNLPFS